MPSPKLISRQIVYGVPPGGYPVETIAAPSHLGTGAIVGIIITILVALLACYTIWRCLRRRRRPINGDVAECNNIEPQHQTGFSRSWPTRGKRDQGKSTPAATTQQGGTEMTSIGR